MDSARTDHVIFVAPFITANARDCIAAISRVEGIRLCLISQDDITLLPADLRSLVYDYRQVADALDSGQLAQAAHGLARTHGTVHRIFAANEQVQVPVALVRRQLGIPGMTDDVMRNFRDKARMKAVLRDAGLPCARFRRISDISEVWDFIRETGYPVIVKPTEGAGAEFTYHADSDAHLVAIMDRHLPSAGHPLMAEEYITGEEFSFDSFTVDGVTVWHSIAMYLPPVLEVRHNPWIQWSVVIPREVYGPAYDAIRAVAFPALRALGAHTGISHMEWFRRPGGEVVISEVGMRPPGAQFTTLMSRAFDFDCLQAWAQLMIRGTFKPHPIRYSAGCTYLRGQGTGIIRSIEGIDTVRRDLGDLITDIRLPEIGSNPTTSYEGDGFIIVRHPDTRVVRDAVQHMVSIVRVQNG